MSRQAWADGTGAPFAVCDPATGELLGSCGLVSIDQDGTGEIGYWTAPWARGRGVDGPGHPGGGPLGLRHASGCAG